ncbi:MAG TPA: PAS domain S-box protein, partial [Acidobacteriota bacterium]|nr:PAS domain S-box protein [Acidobacteriota bacterium]
MRDEIETETLKDPALFYREFFLNSVDGIALMDLQGRILEQNQAHRELLGYSVEDLKGRSAASHLGEETLQGILQALKEGGTYRGEVFSKRKDGTTLHMDLVAFPIRDEKGQMFCYAT